MNRESNELIGRYVYHVGRHLPAERREDVARELTSLVADRVDDEIRPGESRDAVVVRVLREMGPPAEVASRYGYERRLLIGPRSLPAFSKLILVVPIAAVALSLFSVPYGSGDGLTLKSVVMWLNGCVHATLLNLGALVLVFVCLEWFSRMSTKPEPAFDPEKLSPPPPQVADGKVRPGALVFQIYLAFAFLVLFNFYPNIFGGWTSPTGTVFWAVPLSAVGVHVPMWLLNVWLGGSIVLKTQVLRQGAWTRETRWLDVGLSVLGLATFAATLRMSHLGQLDTPFLASLGISETDPRVRALSEASRAMGLVAMPFVLVMLWGIAKDVMRLTRRAGVIA